MAIKKLISSPSSSSSSSDSSFERFVTQRALSLQHKQQHSKEEEEESESEDSSSSSSSDEVEDEEENEEETKSPATKSVSHPSQLSSSEEENELQDAKSQVENSESLVQPEKKKFKPDSFPAKEQISSPSATSSSSDGDKEQFVVQPAPSLKRKQCDSKGKEKVSKGGSSDEEEDEEKAKSPATKSVSHPSQAQQSCTDKEEQQKDTKESVPHPSQQSSEEAKEKEEEEEDAKLPVENSESLVQPEKKKLRPNSVPAGQSPSKTTNSAVQRVWSVEDELVLLRALSHYHSTYGKVPSSKEYDSFLTTIIGSLTFPATEKQLGNKISTWKTNYAQRKKNMGSNAKFLNPHGKKVFQTCANLFEDVSKTKSVGGVTKANSSIYLRELISRQKLPTWLSTVEDVVQQLGESRACDLEAKAKQLSIDATKLHAREEKLMADLFDVVADGMAADD